MLTLFYLCLNYSRHKDERRVKTLEDDEAVEVIDDAAVEVELEVSEDEQPGRELASSSYLILPKSLYSFLVPLLLYKVYCKNSRTKILIKFHVCLTI